MPAWLGYLLMFAALLAVLPLAAWLGRRHGRAVKGNLALASILLGFGQPLDPPTRHLVEAKEGETKGPDAAGDPPTP